MATLYQYFKDFWKLAVVALILAAINQVFSLLDPLIFRHIIDSYATRYREYSSPQFVRGVTLLLAAAVGVEGRNLGWSCQSRSSALKQALPSLVAFPLCILNAHLNPLSNY